MMKLSKIPALKIPPKISYNNELPFIIEDGQTIARIRYEKLNKKTYVVYGLSINSNYQNQKLALSAFFFSLERRQELCLGGRRFAITKLTARLKS